MTDGHGSEGSARARTRTEPGLRSAPAFSPTLTVNVVNEARCPRDVVHVGLLLGRFHAGAKRSP